MEGYRKERIARGVKARSDDIYAVMSYREIWYLLFPRLVPVMGFTVVAFLLPEYWQKVVVTTCIFAMLAVSWDFLSSCGLLSLGQALFFRARLLHGRNPQPLLPPPHLCDDPGSYPCRRLPLYPDPAPRHPPEGHLLRHGDSHTARHAGESNRGNKDFRRNRRDHGFDSLSQYLGATDLRYGRHVGCPLRAQTVHWL